MLPSFTGASVTGEGTFDTGLSGFGVEATGSAGSTGSGIAGIVLSGTGVVSPLEIGSATTSSLPGFLRSSGLEYFSIAVQPRSNVVIDINVSNFFILIPPARHITGPCTF